MKHLYQAPKFAFPVYSAGLVQFKKMYKNSIFGVFEIARPFRGPMLLRMMGRVKVPGDTVKAKPTTTLLLVKAVSFLNEAIGRGDIEIWTDHGLIVFSDDAILSRR